jgi:hypothetical protein
MRTRCLVRARVSPSILCFLSAAGRLKPARIAVLGRLELFGDGVSTVDAGVGWTSRLVFCVPVLIWILVWILAKRLDFQAAFKFLSSCEPAHALVFAPSAGVRANALVFVNDACS